MQAGEKQHMQHVHLIVLQHGLWGSPSDVGRLTQHLQTVFAKQQQAGKIAIVNSKCNERALTYDGIDVCGARLAQLIQDQVQQLQGQQNACVTKLSLIGYSLGGLIIRYAAGKLYVAGFFEQVQPANLITIATPHLGSFKQPTSWLARFFNSQVAIIASRTGMQLMLADADYSVPWLAQQQAQHSQAHEKHQQQHANQQQQQGQQQHQSRAAANPSQEKDSSTPQQMQSSTVERQQQQQLLLVELPPGVDPHHPVPLLLLMAHPAGPFFKAAASFTTRIAAANIKYDTTVPYCTAAMCMTNPYEQHLPVPIDPERYPSVVRPATAAEEAQHPVAAGKGRLFLFVLFLPLFPLFYVYSATKGILHHRKARKWPLDTDWVHRYSEAIASGLSPFSASGQTGRQGSRKLLQQEQSHVLSPAAAARHAAQGSGLVDGSLAAGATAAVPTLGSVADQSPFAAAATTGQTAGAAGLRRTSSATAGSQQQQQQQAGAANTSREAAGVELADSCTSPSPAATRLGQLLTEDEVYHASGGAVVVSSQLSAQLSRRLSATQVQEHDGVVEAVEQETWLLQQQQHWMAKQLFENMPPCLVFERSLSSRQREIDGAGSNGNSVAGVVAAVELQQEAESGGGTVRSSAGGGHTAGVSAATEVKAWQQTTEDDIANINNNAKEKVFRSMGGWHRVDVWTGHIHAHATIIIRDKRYESQSRDMFDYLVNHMSL